MLENHNLDKQRLREPSKPKANLINLEKKDLIRDWHHNQHSIYLSYCKNNRKNIVSALVM